MVEVWFVIKIFVLSCFLILVLQYKVDGATAEQKIVTALQKSRVSDWMRDAGTGAVRLTASTVNKVLDNKPAPPEVQAPQLQETQNQIMQKMEKHLDDVNEFAQ